MAVFPASELGANIDVRPRLPAASAPVGHLEELGSFGDTRKRLVFIMVLAASFIYQQLFSCACDVASLHPRQLAFASLQ